MAIISFTNYKRGQSTGCTVSYTHLYYNVELKFEQPADIGANKPRYDFCCQFMCQKVNDLKINMESYFINFNPDKEDIIA